MAKILIYDIETAPNLGYIWGKYEQNVIEYTNEWYMLCFAYKWAGEKQTHVISLPDFKTRYKKDPEDDTELVKALHKLFDEADIVVAHNGNSFDQKKSQARMIANGMLPPSPYKQIDTKLEARKYFKFNSNKLDDLGDLLGLGRKVQTGGFALWRGCMRGDEKMWRKMKRYNKQDVVLLENVYMKLRPWMRTHPNVANIDHIEDGCRNCSSTKIVKNGIQYTNTASYQQFICKNCGAYQKSRKLLKEAPKPKYN